MKKYIEHFEGNLFSSTAPALGHGVNCKGLMGAGIAKEFRRRYPSMFESYEAICKGGFLSPGNIQFYEVDDIIIVNMASQDNPGANAHLHMLQSAFLKAAQSLTVRGIFRIAIPRIGCGIGGLDWEDVEPVIEKIAEDYDLVVEVWTM